MDAAFTAGAGRRAWQRGRRLPALKHASAPGLVSPPSAHRRGTQPSARKVSPPLSPFRAGRRARGAFRPRRRPTGLLPSRCSWRSWRSWRLTRVRPAVHDRRRKAGGDLLVPGLSPSGARVRVAPTYPHGGRDRARIASPPGASPVCGSSAHVRRLWSEDRGGLAARLPRGVPAGHLPWVQMRTRSRRFTPFGVGRAGFRVGRVLAWPCQVRVGNL